MTITILGTPYSIKIHSESEDERLDGCDGYCDWTTKEIVVEQEVNGTLGAMDVYMKKVIRHEIVHAFLVESGLHECSGETDAWAANETMVDWFARQGPKIYKAWQEADALDPDEMTVKINMDPRKLDLREIEKQANRYIQKGIAP